MKVTNSKQLSAYIKDTRLNLGQSQEKIGKKVGIRQDTVSSFEKNPGSTKIETLFKILSALNLELSVRVRNPALSEQKQDDKTTANNEEWQEEW